MIEQMTEEDFSAWNQDMLIYGTAFMSYTIDPITNIVKVKHIPFTEELLFPTNSKID